MTLLRTPAILLVLVLLAWTGCSRSTRRVEVPPPAQVRYRVGEGRGGAAAWLLAGVAGARWDPGLVVAARDLAAVASAPTVRLTPVATALATGRAGFPGDARFARERTRGAFPTGLLEEVRAMTGPGVPLDVAIVDRRFGDGTVLWVVAAAPHLAELDPIPRDLGLDQPLPLRVDAPGVSSLTAFVAAPDGPVTTFALTQGVTRWVDAFHVPGEHRLEVVDMEKGQVLLQFSVWVDQEPPALPALPQGIGRTDPVEATGTLYRLLEERRAAIGLPRLVVFRDFEPLAREHAAFMAATGRVSHVIPGTTEGVAARAWQDFHPRARHTEDVAAAYSAEEALDLAWLSPGHRRNLLCADCTHVSIGVALEPALDVPPRLFVTWELLSFPDGTPARIHRLR